MRNLFAPIRRRIGIQLALALLLLSLAPLFGAGLVLLDLLESSLEREVRREHRALLFVSCTMIQEYLRDARSRLAALAGRIAAEGLVAPGGHAPPDDPGHERLSQRLQAVLQAGDTFRELGCLGGPARADLWARVQRLRPAPGASGSPGAATSDRWPERDDRVLAAARRGETYAAETIAFEDGRPCVAVAVPVPVGGETAGVLIARVDLEPLRCQLGLFARMTTSDARISVADAAGATFVTAGPEPVAEAFEAHAVFGSDWTVAVRQSPQAAFATLADVRWQAALWFGLAVLLALALTRAFARRIVSPVRALAEAAERLARGDLAARARVERDDELGQLARTFDRMAEALERLDEMKGDFVAHVSHELRTPLTSIQLSVANLQEGLLGPVEGRQQAVLERVRTDLERLIRMVNELLEMARLDAGKVALERTAADLGAVARQAVEVARPLAATKKVALTVVEGAAPLTGDPLKLHQVILNLVDNAIKFAPPGGAVTVETAAVDGWVECRVSDDGPGIDPGRLERVFEKFSRPEAGGGARAPGVGLGLSIARKLVELHGGSVRAENRPGGGARFLVRVPACRTS